jgi:hypothetical protein
VVASVVVEVAVVEVSLGVDGVIWYVSVATTLSMVWKLIVSVIVVPTSEALTAIPQLAAYE